jgi:hypothetical protein
VERDEQSRAKLIERINKALYRITHGEGLMRVPADPTDPDLLSQPDEGIARSAEVAESSGSIHVYKSTACQHAEHAQCRKSCKYCPSECVCPCHDAAAQPTEVVNILGEVMGILGVAYGPGLAKYVPLIQRCRELVAAPSALAARLEETKYIAEIVREYDDLDEQTPIDEGHREFNRKYGSCDILPVIQERIAILEAALSAERAKGKA